MASEDNNPLYKVVKEIKLCNDTRNETGFHADLYYNEVTETYVISFAGTDDKKDVQADATIGKNILYGENNKIPQYEMAMEIAELINKIPKEEKDKLNIEVVGHSLGGGLASIVGLETGIETKTFNASAVPDGFLKEKGLYDKVNNGDVQNITSYHTSSDAVTTLQGFASTPAIGISVDIGNSQPELIKTSFEPGDAAFQLGNNIANSIKEHFVKNVVTQVINNNTEKKKEEWDKFHNAQDRLQRELQNAEIEEFINRL